MTPITSFGVFASQQRAGVDDHAPAARHEGVEVVVLDEHDLRVARAEAGGREDRLGVVAQERLDLRVADDGLAASLRLRRRQRTPTQPARKERKRLLARREAKMLDVTRDIRFSRAAVEFGRTAAGRATSSPA